MGDVADLAVSDNFDTCTVDVTEFLKGHKNQFTIEPKQASGEVLRDVVTATGFAGEDIYFTEMYMNGNWSSDEGIATYNSIVYEVQSITLPPVEPQQHSICPTTQPLMQPLISSLIQLVIIVPQEMFKLL